MLYSLSSLNDKQIGQIRSLEGQLGMKLLSFTRHDIQAAKLNQEEIGKVRDIENKLGVALVAIK
jgi:16S rRNA U516 pseudouridylate synthase RsuA-like enzyme